LKFGRIASAFVKHQRKIAYTTTNRESLKATTATQTSESLKVFLKTVSGKCAGDGLFFEEFPDKRLCRKLSKLKKTT